VARYFDEFALDEEFETPARTITEADIVAFAGLSGDYNPVHTDHVYARATQFGAPLAHGLLGLSVATGLVARLGLFDGTAVALLDFEWRFVQPIRSGDTVRVWMRIIDRRQTRHGSKGILNRQLRLLNQHNEVVQEGTSRLMVLCRRGVDTPPSQTQ
jgi:acyl dehydratase